MHAYTRSLPKQGEAAVPCSCLMNETHAPVRTMCSQLLRTPLHIAAWHGRHGIVRSLLAAGADVNAQDEVGLAPVAISYLVSISHGPLPGDAFANYTCSFLN